MRQKENSSFIVQLFFLFIINTLSYSSNEVLMKIGKLSLFITFAFFIGMFLFVVKNRELEKEKGTKWLSFIIVITVFVIILSGIISRTVSLLFISELILLYLFMWTSAHFTWKDRHIKMAAYLFAAVSIFFFMDWVLSDFISYRFKSIYQNPNYLAIFLLCSLYFKTVILKTSGVFERIYFVSIIAIDLLLIYCTNSRSVWLTITIVMLTWLLITFKKKILKYLIYMVFLFNILFISIYISLQQTTIGIIINEWSVKYLGKNFFSGREDLWREVLNKIQEKWFFGYGVGITAQDVTNFSLTAHNQYLQLLLETGIVGLFLFSILIVMIWKMLIDNVEQVEARWSVSFLIGFLIYENFELTLFQNNYTIAFLQWLIITIGIQTKMMRPHEREQIGNNTKKRFIDSIE